MLITRLTAKNFMKLDAISVLPKGAAVVKVGGKNGAGKSSLLTAIEVAIGGKRRAPADPVKHGTKGAEIILETETIKVVRHISAKGGWTVDVSAKDGSKFASPQAMLDDLAGPLFDPFAFGRMEPRAQAELLRKLVKLDFATEDKAKQLAYDERTVVGREIKRLEGALAKLPEAPIDAPPGEISVAELAAEVERRHGTNTANANARRELTDLRSDAVNTKATIDALEAKLVEARAKLNDISARGKVLAARVTALVDEDVQEVKAQIATAEQTNRAVRARTERERLQGELDAAIDTSEKLTQRITEIDGVKADAASKAKYPVDGLAVTDDGVTLGGVPYAQASQAEQLRCSVAIGLAMQPEFRVLRIRDGSLLDEDSERLVAEMAEAAGGQVWIEKVSKDGEGCSILIEDGAVAEDRNEKPSGTEAA